MYERSDCVKMPTVNKMIWLIQIFYVPLD